MKKLSFILLCFLFTSATAQVGWNLTLLSHFQDTHLATIDWNPGNQIWNDCTGWFDTIKKREYAIAGSVDSIYFFDISNPYEMKKCAVQSGINHATNRDMEVYDHYVYCVSDNGSPGVMQIFDMKYLPDSVHKVYESDSTGMNSHTLFVNSKSKRLYKCINRYKQFNLVTCMEVFSLENPERPKFLFRFDRSNYNDVHESYVRNDTVYCSDGYAGLFIYDVNDILHPREIGKIVPPYPENAYNHSNWLDSSGKYLLFTDETPEGTGLKLYNISDYSNIYPMCPPFRDYGSPHNSFWVGRFAYTSMYYGGVNIYDLSDPVKPKMVGYYKTFDKSHTTGRYEGCWGIYPFLHSGNIIASDMNTGIYLLKPNGDLTGTAEENNALMGITIFPNPFKKVLNLSVFSNGNQKVQLLVYNLQGKIAAQKEMTLTTGENNIELNELENFASGVYFISCVSTGCVLHYPIIKSE